MRTEKDEKIRCLKSEVKRLRVENEELILNEEAFKDKDAYCSLILLVKTQGAQFYN